MNELRWGEKLSVLLLAVLVDRVLGEPPARVHPVVWIGKLIGVLARQKPEKSRWSALGYGGLITAATVGTAWGASTLVDRLVGRLPFCLRVLVRALFLKPTFAVRTLLAAGEAVRLPLEHGDLARARAALRSLVSRPSEGLDPPLVAAAAIESLAENASDSIVAPVLAYLVAGVSGAYVYRAANTLDAMIGYHGQYEYLGKCAARLDDLLNLIPARLTTILIVVAARLTGSNGWQGLATAWREHRKTASPNAGWPMSAMAGALGVQLEKVGHYRLGDGLRQPAADDIRRAERVVDTALTMGLLILTCGAIIPTFVGRSRR